MVVLLRGNALIVSGFLWAQCQYDSISMPGYVAHLQKAAIRTIEIWQKHMSMIRLACAIQVSDSANAKITGLARF